MTRIKIYNYFSDTPRTPYHKPNLLSWDQDVAASPREFRETDNNRTNSPALLATWQYFSFRHIWFPKILSY